MPLPLPFSRHLSAIAFAALSVLGVAASGSASQAGTKDGIYWNIEPPDTPQNAKVFNLVRTEMNSNFSCGCDAIDESELGVAAEQIGRAKADVRAAGKSSFSDVYSRLATGTAGRRLLTKCSACASCSKTMLESLQKGPLKEAANTELNRLLDRKLRFRRGKSDEEWSYSRLLSALPAEMNEDLKSAVGALKGVAALNTLTGKLLQFSSSVSIFSPERPWEGKQKWADTFCGHPERDNGIRFYLKLREVCCPDSKFNPSCVNNVMSSISNPLNTLVLGDGTPSSGLQGAKNLIWATTLIGKTTCDAGDAGIGDVLEQMDKTFAPVGEGARSLAAVPGGKGVIQASAGKTAAAQVSLASQAVAAGPAQAGESAAAPGGGSGSFRCPSFIPSKFCGNGIYDPRKYRKNSRGVFVYDESAAIPDDYSSIQELFGKVNDGVLASRLQDDLVDFKGQLAIESVLQESAITMNPQDFNKEVESLAKTAACLPSKTGPAIVKALAAQMPVDPHAVISVMQDGYRERMAIGAQCMAAINKRVQTLRTDIGLNTQPLGPWIDTAPLRQQYGDTAGFLAEMVIGFHPGVSLIIFNDHYIHADRIGGSDAPKCAWLNEAQTLETRNQCDSERMEFLAESNEINGLADQFPELTDKVGDGSGMDAIVTAGGIDPRLADYDLNPYRLEGLPENKEKDQLEFCMDRAIRLQIKPSKAALNMAAQMMRDKGREEVKRLEHSITAACANKQATAVEEILDPITMGAFFSCSRPRFGRISELLGQDPARDLDRLNDSDCRDRINSSMAACAFWTRTDMSKQLQDQGKLVAVKSAELLMDGVSIATYGGASTLFKGLLKGGVGSILRRMTANGLKGAVMGAGMGTFTAGVQTGVQYVAGDTLAQRSAAIDQQQLKILNGQAVAGTYEGVQAMQSALDEAAKKSPIVEAAVKGAKAGVLFGIAFGSAHETPSSGARGLLPPEVSDALRLKLVDIYEKLSIGLSKLKSGSKEIEVVAEADHELRPAVEAIAEAANPHLKPEDLAKLSPEALVQETKTALATAADTRPLSEVLAERSQARRSLTQKDPQFFSDPAADPETQLKVRRLAEKDPVHLAKVQSRLIDELRNDPSKVREFVRRLARLSECPVASVVREMALDCGLVLVRAAPGH